MNAHYFQSSRHSIVRRAMIARALVALLLVAASLPAFGDTASAHIHTHQHNKIDSNERMEDGAFSPRDADHYTEGEHHQEFDHEAILGTERLHFLDI